MEKSDLLQLRNRNARVELRDQVLGIEKNPNRILGKLGPKEPGVTFFGGVEVIDLQFDLIAVGVGVVHGGGRPVVDRPHRDDPGRL